jgi:hydroxymethylpyrimidine/phosphomethylpyrimidine kinase
LLLLGGLDPSGGAGLTVDAVVAASHDCHVLPVATAWTVQNRRAFVERRPVAAERWRAALAAALADGEVHAVKVGMLGEAAAAAAVATSLAPLVGQVPIVVDPVLVSTAAGPGAPAALAIALREQLVPLASLLLPNRPEAAAMFAGDPPRGLALGAAAVLAKGGHDDGPSCTDTLLVRGRDPVPFCRPRLPVGPVRGTGCALATAIAARLAHGVGLEAACREAGDWLHSLLRQLGPAPGDGLPRALPLAAQPPALRRTST